LAGKEATETVKKAIQIGYNHIDTAEMYGNEKQISEAIKNFDREKLFLTSKVWYENLNYQSVIHACKKSLKELRTDYLNLYLIHWPNPSIDMKETFQALKELYSEGLIRAVGVSNFTIRHLKQALPAYRPIAKGLVNENNIINQIAKKYQKTSVQITLRWLIQQNIVVIPKASSEKHLKENLDIFDFELDHLDIETIKEVNQNKRMVNSEFADFDD